jgi:hypothetical protein
MQLYPSYQLPPQVRALAGRSVGGTGGSPNDVYLNHPRGGVGAASMVQAPQQDGAPQAVQDAAAAAYTQQQQAQAQRAISGAGPGIMPVRGQQSADMAAQQVAQQQFLAGAAEGIGAGGLRATPPQTAGTPQYSNLPPQIAALVNSYGAPQVQGVQQPGTAQPVQQPVRPDLSNQAGYLGGYRPALVR